MSKKGSFKQIIEIVFKLINRKKFILLFALIILKLIFSLPIPLIQKKLMDSIVSKNIEVLMNLAFILIALSLGQIFINVIYNIKYSIFIQDLNFKFRVDILRKVFNAKYSNVKNINSSYLLNNIYTDTDQIESFVFNTFLNVISNIVTFIYGTFVIFAISYKIALMIFCIVFVWVFIYIFFKKRIYRYNYNLKEENSKLFSKFNESLSMLESIKKNHSYEVEISKLHLKYISMINYFKKFIKFYSIFTSISSSINLCISVIIICFGVVEIYANKMTIGDLFAVNAAVGFMVVPVQSFLTILSDYPNFQVSCNRVLELYKLKSNEEGIIKVKKIDSIQLNNIKFSFSNEKLINDMSYRFVKDQIYVICGQNGTGKTSLINILLKLLEQSDGEIIINDSIKINEIDSESYLDMIAIVEQEQRLFYDTLFNNMTYNIKGKLSSERFNELIKLVGLEQLIKILPQGIDTFIEENSANISGGQKQKISIFRALLKNTDVIILDEPTSALDSLSVEELKSILNKVKKDKIIIIVTHNKSLISDNNQIIDFDKANVIEV